MYNQSFEKGVIYTLQSEQTFIFWTVTSPLNTVSKDKNSVKKGIGYVIIIFLNLHKTIVENALEIQPNIQIEEKKESKATLC